MACISAMPGMRTSTNAQMHEPQRKGHASVADSMNVTSESRSSDSVRADAERIGGHVLNG